MEIKLNAIAVKTVDYKDSDKILTLYSIEKGKITAGIKGVKKAGAKLKFASEPFCFAEYVLAEKNGRYTVIGASHIDSFYNLRLDMVKYYTSAVVAETLNALTESEMADVELFTLSLKTIKDVCYQKDELISLSAYLLNLADILGYKISEPICSFSGEEISGRVFFRVKDAVFCSEAQKGEGFMEIKRETFNALTYLKALQIKAPVCVKLEDCNFITLIKFLNYYLNVKTETRLKSAEVLIKFLENS